MSTPKRGSAEWRKRVREKTREGIARRSARLRLRPADLVAFEKRGLVNERLAPLVEFAGAEAASVLAGLGGAENVSPQRQILLEDFVRVGVALRALTGLLLQGGDVVELSSRIAQLTNTRRQHLQALGLERYEKSLDLDTYARAVHEATARDQASAATGFSSPPASSGGAPSPGAAGAGVAEAGSDDPASAPRAKPNLAEVL